MSDVHVLVVFYSRRGTTESLALAAGLGAIQKKAAIRLRRAADLASADEIECDPDWREHRLRMQRDYVTPRDADAAWADVIVLATPGAEALEIERYCQSLRSVGDMTGKIAAVLSPGNDETALKPIYAAAACAGLIVYPAALDPANATASATGHGRRIVSLAQSMKSS